MSDCANCDCCWQENRQIGELMMTVEFLEIEVQNLKERIREQEAEKAKLKKELEEMTKDKKSWEDLAREYYEKRHGK